MYNYEMSIYFKLVMFRDITHIKHIKVDTDRKSAIFNFIELKFWTKSSIILLTNDRVAQLVT